MLRWEVISSSGGERLSASEIRRVHNIAAALGKGNCCWWPRSLAEMWIWRSGHCFFRLQHRAPKAATQNLGMFSRLTGTSGSIYPSNPANCFLQTTSCLHIGKVGSVKTGTSFQQVESALKLWRSDPNGLFHILWKWCQVGVVHAGAQPSAAALCSQGSRCKQFFGVLQCFFKGVSRFKTWSLTTLSSLVWQHHSL